MKSRSEERSCWGSSRAGDSSGRCHSHQRSASPSRSSLDGVGRLADGWREVPLSQAQPGDVFTFDGPEGNGQHVGRFNAWVNGKPQYVGSNNVNADGSQRISFDTGAWAYRVHICHPN